MARTLNLGTALLKLAAKTEGFSRATSDIKALSGGLDKTARQAHVFDQRMRGLQFARFTAAITGVATAIGTVGLSLRESIVVGAQFGAQMMFVKSVSKATDDQLHQLSESALTLAETTKFTAREIAGAMKFMAMAGNDAKTIIGAMPAVLELAAAGATDVGKAADIVTNIMSGFGTETSKLSKINDVLVAGFTSSNVTLEELGRAFSEIGPTARLAGIGIEDVTGALGILGNAGIKGNKAGRALSRMLQQLTSPSDRAAKAQKRLGVSINDVSKGFGHLTRRLEEARGRLTNEAFLGALKDAFDTFGGRAAAALVVQGADNVDKLLAKINELNGISADIAKQNLNTLAGDWEKFVGVIETLAIRLEQTLDPALRKLVQWSTAVGEFFSDVVAWDKEISIELGIRAPDVRPQDRGADRLRQDIIDLEAELARVQSDFFELNAKAGGALNFGNFVSPRGGLGLSIDEIIEKLNSLRHVLANIDKPSKRKKDILEGVIGNDDLWEKAGERAIESFQKGIDQAIDAGPLKLLGSLTGDLRAPDVKKLPIFRLMDTQLTPEMEVEFRIRQQLNEITADTIEEFGRLKDATAISRDQMLSRRMRGGRAGIPGMPIVDLDGSPRDIERREGEAEDVKRRKEHSDAFLSSLAAGSLNVEAFAGALGASEPTILAITANMTVLSHFLNMLGTVVDSLTDTFVGFLSSSEEAESVMKPLSAALAGTLFNAATVPVGAFAGLTQLAQETDSFKRFGKALDEGFKRIVAAAEPLFQSLMPLAGLFIQFADVIAVSLSQFFQIRGFGELLFNIFKYIAVGLGSGLVAITAIVDFIHATADIFMVGWHSAFVKIHEGWAAIVDRVYAIRIMLEKLLINVGLGDSGELAVLTTARNQAARENLDATTDSAVLVIDAMNQVHDSFADTRIARSQLAEIFNLDIAAAGELARSFADLEENTRSTNQELRNLPEGFKVANAIFNAQNPIKPGGTAGGSVADQFTERASEVINIESMVVVANDPREFVEKTNRALRRSNWKRSGMSTDRLSSHFMHLPNAN